MNREIVYEIQLDPKDMTKQEAIDMDRRQSWRQKISSWQMEDLSAYRAMYAWAQKITEKPHMEELMRKAGAWRLARSGLGMLKKAFEKTAYQVSAVQLRTIDANWQHITLSSSCQVKGYVNVDTDVLEVLIQQTLEACQERFCMMDEKSSRRCPVRQALDQTMNAGRIHDKREEYAGDVCPYCLKKTEGADKL